jgi:4-hydroxy-3-polyprenylbenzoate decarboxylase
VSEQRKEGHPLLLAITGASGSIYALEFARLMERLGQPLHLVISETGTLVLEHELGPDGIGAIRALCQQEYPSAAIGAAPASGSSRWQAMVILPCTMGTLGAIMSGASRNLIHRAADCFLKERRQVVAVVRETPLNRIHMRNMLAFHDAGGTIFPAMPAFYHRPSSIEELARFFACRIAEFLGFQVDEMEAWKGL